jgi:hypothetical protein
MIDVGQQGGDAMQPTQGKQSTESTKATQAINLAGQRVLLTQASDFMGPALAEVFRECGADVIAADGPITDPEYPQQLIDVSGEIDVLLLNLGVPAPTSPAGEL